MIKHKSRRFDAIPAGVLPVGTFLVFMILMIAQAFAQTETTTSATDGSTPLGLSPGMPAGSYALSGFDSINPYNGNLSFHLPLLKMNGRGGAAMTMTLAIDTKSWHVRHGEAIDPNTGEPLDTFTPDQNYWVGYKPGYGPGFLTGRHSGAFPLQSCSLTRHIYQQTLTRLTFITSDGTEYELRDQLTNGKPAEVTDPCASGASRGVVFVTADGSAATFISTLPSSDTFQPLNDNPVAAGSSYIYPSGYLLLRDGTRYRIDNGSVTWLRDRNGNLLNFSYDDRKRVTTITDSLNRQVTITYDHPDVSPNLYYDQISFTGVNGAARTLKISYRNLDAALRPNSGYSIQNLRQLFPELYSPTSTGGTTPYDPVVISSVLLPDQARHYQLYYNSYAELARVELPTGGAIEYDAAAGSGAVYDGVDYQIFRRVAVRRVLPNGTNMEGQTIFTLVTSSGTTTTTVDHKDPSFNPLARENHYYHGDPVMSLFSDAISYPAWTDGKEFQTDSLDTNGTTVLHSVANDWTQQSDPVWWTSGHATAPPNNPVITKTDTTLVDTNQVAEQAFLYDSYFNRTDVKEYDFGSGAAGALLRHTHTDFVQTYSGTSYDTPITDANNPPASSSIIHLRNLPWHQFVYNGSESQQAQTTFEYDNYNADGNHAALLPRSGISGIDPMFNTNARGNVTASTRWLSTGGSVDSYSQYDIAGNVIKSIDPLGNLTQIDYSSAFQYAYPTTTTSPVPDPSGVHGSSSSLITHTNYDFSTGKVVSTTDPNGKLTAFCYLLSTSPSCSGNPEPFDRLTKTLRADGGVTNFTYDDAALTIMTAQDQYSPGDGQIRSLTAYDGLGRVIHALLESDPQGTVHTDNTYDAMGRKSTASNPYRTSNDTTMTSCRGITDSTNGTTTYTYDAVSRIKTVTEADGSLVRTGYLGNQTTVTDEAGKARQSITDALGRLTRIIEDPAGLNYSTLYTYDVLDNLIRVQQGTQTPRTFVYDSLKRLRSATNPENGTVDYTYDANGNLLTKRDARAITVSQQYDGLNRVHQKSYNDGVTPFVSYKYDGVGASVPNPLGHLTQISSTVSATNYTGFDSMGRVTGSSQITPDAALGSPTYSLSYGYNLAGEMTLETYPSGRVTNTTYDAAGRASTMTGGLNGVNKSYVQSMSYSPQGDVISMALENTLTETRSYNNRLQPTSICLGNLGGFNYAYALGSNNGNVISQTITAVNQTQTYSYDNLNRLTGVSETSGWNHTYGYDPYGNRNAGSSNSPYLPVQVPNISSENNKIAATSYSYDPAGNLTLGLGSDGSAKTYTYDAENRLTNFNGQATYVYDGDGRRVKKVVGNTTTVFTYDATGKLVAEYSNAAPWGGGTRYLTADHLGSTRVVTDVTGAVLARYDYLPFGEEISSGIGGRTTTPPLNYDVDEGILQKFTAKERDSESGLDYYGARFNSSPLGRFVTPDPSRISVDKSDPQSWNRFAHTFNNHLRYVDTNGLWPTPTHNDIYEVTLSGLLTKDQMKLVRAISAQQDSFLGGGQGPENSFKHGMCAPHQGSGDCTKAIWSFILSNENSARMANNGNFSDEAVSYFANAAHTLTDLASPWHTDDNGMSITWNGMISRQSWSSHIFPEGLGFAPIPWFRLGEAITLLAHDTYNTFPAARKKMGDPDRYAQHAIEQLVHNYFWYSSPPLDDLYEYHIGQRVLLENRARLCALGNPAACQD